MKNSDGFNAGWIDTSIGALLQNSRLIHQFEAVLVTSIDSSRDLSQMRVTREILQHYPECQLLGAGLVVPSDRFEDFSTTFKLFTGFDEVWWFDAKPLLAKPDELSLVAPLNLATDEIPSEVTHWMHESKCRLGLGDGIGLNFVTSDEGIAKMLGR